MRPLTSQALPCDLSYDCSLHLHEEVEPGHVFASSGELPSILGEPVQNAGSRVSHIEVLIQ